VEDNWAEEERVEDLNFAKVEIATFAISQLVETAGRQAVAEEEEPEVLGSSMVTGFHQEELEVGRSEVPFAAEGIRLEAVLQY
jgi:hypothetical protein